MSPSSLLTRLLQPEATGIDVVSSLESLSAIQRPGCAGVVWNRTPLPGFQAWLDGLAPDRLPRARVVLPVESIRLALREICNTCETPDGAERARLIDDISALASAFSALMGTAYLRLRLDAVTTNSCRKFHVDAMTARLICTYRGTGTQYGIARDGADPERIHTAATGAPLLLRGTLWPETPRSGLVHRSPPIEGSGETRLVLVLDPVSGAEDAH